MRKVAIVLLLLVAAVNLGTVLERRQARCTNAVTIPWNDDGTDVLLEAQGEIDA